MTTYTYERDFAARTPSGAVVIIPDQVAEAQRDFDGKTFPALRLNGQRVRVKLRGDLYGLWTTGTGDAVVAIC